MHQIKWNRASLKILFELQTIRCWIYVSNCCFWSKFNFNIFIYFGPTSPTRRDQPNAGIRHEPLLVTVVTKYCNVRLFHCMEQAAQAWRSWKLTNTQSVTTMDVLIVWELHYKEWNVSSEMRTVTSSGKIWWLYVHVQQNDRNTPVLVTACSICEKKKQPSCSWRDENIDGRQTLMGMSCPDSKTCFNKNEKINKRSYCPVTLLLLRRILVTLILHDIFLPYRLSRICRRFRWLDMYLRLLEWKGWICPIKDTPVIWMETPSIHIVESVTVGGMWYHRWEMDNGQNLSYRADMWHSMSTFVLLFFADILWLLRQGK